MATQTPGAQKAMIELLNFDETKNLAYPLRYLLGAAYTTHPGEYLVKDLLVTVTAVILSKKKYKDIVINF